MGIVCFGLTESIAVLYATKIILSLFNHTGILMNSAPFSIFQKTHFTIQNM
jgi:hypothetical protein